MRCDLTDIQAEQTTTVTLLRMDIKEGGGQVNTCTCVRLSGVATPSLYAQRALPSRFCVLDDIGGMDGVVPRRYDSIT